MKKMIGILVLLGGALLSQAQGLSGKVTGHVIDGNQKVIESATITLLKAKDSSIAKMGAAGKEGSFVFDAIPTGKYIVSVSAIGHKKAFSTTFEINATNTSVDLKTIALV